MPLIAVLMIISGLAYAAESEWPGFPPDCWHEARIYHPPTPPTGQRTDWKNRTTIRRIDETMPGDVVMSPNKGYSFFREGVRQEARIVIYAEKEHLVEISFVDVHGLTDVKWINEKLLFLRPWWGRLAATDIIYDVEREQIIYAEAARYGGIAFQQFHASCPKVGGCECIKKDPN